MSRLDLSLLDQGESFDDIARRAGVDTPMLAPGDQCMEVVQNTQLYWPVVDPALQEQR